MEEINEDDIINEDNEIVDFLELREVMNSGIEKCVCKIAKEVNINGQSIFKTASGFFCNIPIKKIKVFLTNNHFIDEEYLNNEQKIIYYNYRGEKNEINLQKDRFKLSDKVYDFTVIEILDEDNITDFLELDDVFIENEQVFTAQYPKGGNLQYSHGKILGIAGKYLLYSLGTTNGSSGSPIISLNTRKVIGLHKGAYKSNDMNDENNKKNLGIKMKDIVHKIQFIKCKYNIKSDDVGKEIQIINNGKKDMLGTFVEVNKEIKDKIKVIIEGKKKSGILKYIFNREGIYIVYILVDDSFTDMSCMFTYCLSLIEISFSSFESYNIKNMRYLFQYCDNLVKIDFSSFKTDNVTNMRSMFAWCRFLKNVDLSSFKTNKVTDMGGMFGACGLQKINLSNFNTENVVDMECMFTRCCEFKEIDLSSFRTDNVVNMGNMFSYCDAKKINLQNFKSDKVTNMGNMFFYIPKSCTLNCDDIKIKEEFKTNEKNKWE